MSDRIPPNPRRRLAAALSVTALLAGACAAPEAPQDPAPTERPTERPAEGAPAPWPAGDVRRVASNSGEFTVEYAVRPQPLPLNEPFEIDLRVREASGAPADDVEVTVDAWMPAHRHGMNRRPRVEALGGGRFRARGLLLHMGGHWVLTFDLSRAGSTDRAQVDVRL